MKIGIISASVRVGRRSHQVAEALLDSMKSRNIDVELIDLMQFNIPRFTGEPEKSGDIPLLSNKMEGMDGFIIVTPEYNSGHPASLKDLIDHLKRDVFRKKPIGISSVSAGRMAGTRVALQLQLIILGIFGLPIPNMLMVGDVDEHFENGKIRSGDFLEKSVESFLDEYLWFAQTITEKKISTVSQ